MTALPGIDPVVEKDLAGEGVEVGLGDLEVVAPEDGPGVGLLHRRPHGPVGEALAELAAQDLDRLVDAPRRQLQLLQGVAMDPLPVALLEALPHPPGDGPQPPVVLVKGLTDGLGAAGGGGLEVHGGPCPSVLVRSIPLPPRTAPRPPGWRCEIGRAHV